MKKILIIDDSTFFIKLTQDALEKAGYEVLIAQDGKIALEVLNSTLPDVIFLDVIMPNMDGFDFLSTVRSNPTLKNIPIFVISSLSQPEDQAKALELGATGYIVKDVGTMQDVLKKIGVAETEVK